MEYTKGEWEAHTEPEYTVNNVWSKQGTSGSLVATVNTPEDAHLIAAAPDIYEALKELLGALGNPMEIPPYEVVEKASVALSKVEN